MGISIKPSTVTLPGLKPPYPSIMDFLVMRFPRIPREIWESRLSAGKILDENMVPINRETAYRPLMKLHYFREVEKEPEIPFHEEVVHEDNHILVCCKPHFLPVTPSGPYVTQTLLSRMQKRSGNTYLVPIHRIDRETAGLVIFSKDPETRGKFQSLFMNKQVRKTYEAVAGLSSEPEKTSFRVESRIVPGDPWFRMKTTGGKVNAISEITLVRYSKDRALFRLHPVTGKKHQLRIHMARSGFGILNDPFYPELDSPKEPGDFSSPLQLIARQIEFRHPVSGKHCFFESSRLLSSMK